MWTAARQDGAFTMLSQAYVRWLVVITHPERTNQSCQVKKTTTSSVKSVNPNAENAHLFQKKRRALMILGASAFPEETSHTPIDEPSNGLSRSHDSSNARWVDDPIKKAI